MRLHMLFLCLALGLTAGVRADEIKLPNVTVYGTAVTEITPDLLRWSLTVKNQGADLANVAERHANLVAEVLSLLKNNGVEEADTQTAHMEFGENWEYRDNSRVRNGYVASTSISFKMHQLTKYRDVWIALAGQAGVSIDSVYFDSSKRIETQNETRRKALMAARDKARDMARALGSEIGEPLLIEEVQGVDDVFSGGVMMNSISREESYDDASGGSPISPGQIQIRIRVKASFRLVGNS